MIAPESSQPLLGDKYRLLEPNTLRGEIVDRLQLVVHRHARHQADRQAQGEFPLARNIVVFFYREPGPADA
jgi:hypothetical protein